MTSIASSSCVSGPMLSLILPTLFGFAANILKVSFVLLMTRVLWIYGSHVRIEFQKMRACSLDYKWAGRCTTPCVVTLTACDTRETFVGSWLTVSIRGVVCGHKDLKSARESGWAKEHK